jgi:hypothetical protein
MHFFMLKNSLKYIVIPLSLLLCSTASIFAETAIQSFLKKFRDPIYQDVVIDNTIYPIGTDICEPRYDLIKPVFNLYNRPFSVLDLGAAQGYFSFRTAYDYPHSACVMVEADMTAYYGQHGSMLHDLCQKNSKLNNIFFLKRALDLSDLTYLNKKEHFDVVLAFLVVHLMHKDVKEQIKIVETLLQLGDNVILEVANNVDVVHTAYVESLSRSLDCKYLGEVKRHKDPNPKGTGKLYWFKRKTSSPTTTDGKNYPFIPIKKETFSKLGGVYPQDFSHSSN